MLYIINIINMNKVKSIFILAGHSKFNPWASFNWLDERELVKQITSRLSDELDNIDIPVYVIWLETDVSLEDKAKQVNQICKVNWYTVDNSILIEIHCNAWGWTWIETLGYTDYPDFKELWFALVDQVCKSTWLRDRGLKDWSKFYIVNSTIPLATIFECWFIDTKADRLILQNNIESFSNGLFNGLKEYVGFTEDIDYEELYNIEKTRADKLQSKLDDIVLLIYND